MKTFWMFLLLSAPVWAETQVTFMRAMDLNAAAGAYLYCNTVEGRNDFKILTSGSSTTVTGASGTSPFDQLGVGDDITAQVSGSYLTRTITAKASGSSVTVDSAINLSGNGTTGYPFTYRDLRCGSTDADGWVNTDGMASKTLFLRVIAMTATGGMDYSIECRGTGDIGAPDQLVGGTVTTAITAGTPSTTLAPFLIPERCASLRVGVRFVTTDDAGTDSISAYLRATSD
jgi:hypothetical protein